MATSDTPHRPASALEEAPREALLAAVRALLGASVQKVWLVSPTLVALQVRTPGKSSIAIVDAERAMALVADARPAAPESALKAQATLRAALAGARLDSVSAIVAADAPERARASALRLEFSTPRGARALLADPRAHALVLAARDDSSREEKIVWTAPGAAAAFRPGASIAPWKPAPPASREPRVAADQDSRAGEHLDASAGRALSLAALEARAGEQLAAEKERLVRALKARAQKLARTLGAVERDSAQASRAVAARRFAELLLPMQAKIARGAKVGVVPDWSQLDEEGRPAQVSVALDPALGAAENASRMLKKAHRYAAAAPRIAARLAEISRALEDAKSQLARAERATDAKELRELSESSGREHRSQPRPARSAPQGRLPYRAFRASNGARILVGRSAKDNDALTSRARGDDLWLHARGVHGSHVILAEPGHAPDSRALAEAALLAAHFSSARGAHFAEVSWTRRKYVRKGKGLAPGAVTFSQEKTLRVRLDEPLLQALLAREE